ncbi:hypothetical protein Tco_1217719 [Tanacetum coccineum]
MKIRMKTRMGTVMEQMAMREELCKLPVLVPTRIFSTANLTTSAELRELLDWQDGLRKWNLCFASATMPQIAKCHWLQPTFLGVGPTMSENGPNEEKRLREEAAENPNYLRYVSAAYVHVSAVNEDKKERVNTADWIRNRKWISKKRTKSKPKRQNRARERKDREKSKRQSQSQPREVALEKASKT